MLSAYLAGAFVALPYGAMYALQATGIVLVFRTTRVFNFAQAGMGVAAAYVAAKIASALGGGYVVSFLGALLGIAVAAGIGILVELTVRATKGTLQRTVVTLGWLLFLQSIIIAIFTSNTTLQPARLFSDRELFRVPYIHSGVAPDQIALVVIAAVVAVGLTLFLAKTPFGIAMRAVADDTEAGGLLGLRVSRVLLTTWALGGAVAGLAGVLIAPFLGTLDTYSLFLLTVEAIAAALVGGLTSLPLAFGGGIAVAVISGLAKVRFPSESSTVPEAVAFLVVLAAVLLRRRRGRVDVSEGGLVPVRIRPLPSGMVAAVAAGATLAAVLVVPLLFGTIGDSNIAQIGAWGIAALSVVLLTGVAGQVSVCQCVFMGVGAVAAGSAHHHGAPFLLCLLIGAIVAAAAAALVGIPALRLEPIELAIVTVAFGFAADGFLFLGPVTTVNNTTIPRPGWLGTQHSGPLHYAWLVLGIFALASLAVAFLRRGRTGAALTALRSSSAATAAMGFSVTASKLTGFAAAGALAGVAGVLFSAVSGSASVGGSAASLSTVASISLLAYALIAGVGNVPAALVGGLLVVLPSISAGGAVNPHVFGLINAASGAALVAVLIVLPQGLASLFGFLPRLQPLRAKAVTT
jgi:branched-chain amino acid transport system permease protein